MRLADNPALAAAVAAGGPVIALYILDDVTPGEWRWGGASRWWLHHSLAALTGDLERRGGRLVLRRGEAQAVLEALIAETKAERVVWNRCYEPFAITRDRGIKAALTEAGIEARSFNASLLFEPWTVQTRQGGPFKVFTPFWKSLMAQPEPEAPAAAPEAVPTGPKVKSETLADWALLPRAPDWADGLRESWQPGEAAAKRHLAAWLGDALGRYETARDRPAEPGTSRLSPHLHWGEIGPRQVWHAVRTRSLEVVSDGTEGAGLAFLRQIAWREFCHHLLFHWPDLPDTTWRSSFQPFPWRDDDPAFRAWSRGMTGYPLVDAGMRELWASGWMHNRVRMVAASFLTKHLLISWQRGAAWFWDTLVDGDLANNSAGWQWVAGCGADAAPYFRIFNPVLQGERFDPDGVYIRRWVPELARLPNAMIHRPWEASPSVLRDAGVDLGRTYPNPMIDHAAARARALAAYKSLSEAD